MKTIMEQFLKQVTLNGDHVAIKDGSSQVTYLELYQLACQIAAQIPLTKGEFIGIFLPKSIDNIACMLASLLQGAVYIPIDAAYPQGKVDYIIKDSQLKKIITNKELASRVKTVKPSIIDKSLFIDIANTHYSLPSSRDLAYMIYTSGSTGKPKGVLIEHVGIVNLAKVFGQVGDIKPGKNILQLASYGFDASVAEIYPALLNGATLNIINDSTQKDPIGLANYIKDNNINFAIIPPSILSLMPEISLPTLTHLMVAGEICNKKTMDYWSNGRKLINAYGPTEDSVCSSLAIYDPDRMNTHIGQAIDGHLAIVLDENLFPVNPGEEGQLYMGGIGLAREYWNRPELTQEKFITLDLPNIGIQRLYATGDLVKLLENTDMQYIGRGDFQVKINGIRIELGEIEDEINSLPQVNQSIVILLKMQNTQLLICFLLLKDSINSNENFALCPEPLENQIRTILANNLPSYMIPNWFFITHDIILTSNNKIDRDKYKEQATQLIETTESFDEKALSESEILLKDIWAKILPNDFNSKDSFYKVGGTSLNASQLIREIKGKFGVKLQYKQVYQYQRFKDMVEFIDRIKE